MGCASGGSPSFTGCQVLSESSVEGTDQVGGFIGYHKVSGGNVNTCSSAATVKGADNVGGFVGACAGGVFKGARANANAQSSCKASGNVSGDGALGGFVGKAEGGSFDCCDATGTVSANATCVGGFVGESAGSLSYAHCRYWGTEVKSIYSGDDDVNIGGFCGGIKEAFTGSFSKCWVSQGGSGLSINSSNSKSRVGGFVGTIGVNTNSGADNLGKIEKCRVHKATVSGGKYTGGFAGVSYVNIEQCCVTGKTDISSTKDAVGGFAGYQQFNGISYCYTLNNAKGNTSSSANVGGMVGTAKSTTIQECYVGGTTVTGKSTSTGSFIGTAEFGRQDKCIAWVETGWYGNNTSGKESTYTNCHRKQNDSGKYVSTYANSYGWATSIWNVSDFSTVNKNDFGLKETETILDLN